MAGTAQASAANLDWELERPFRFFRYPSDNAVQRIAFDLLASESKPTNTEAVEALLNGGSFWLRKFPAPEDRPVHWPTAWRTASIKTPFDIVAHERAAEHRPMQRVFDVDRQGWASPSYSPNRNTLLILFAT